MERRERKKRRCLRFFAEFPGERVSGKQGKCIDTCNFRAAETLVGAEKEEALRQFIIHELHSGATIYEAIGAYNKEKHNEIITIVDKSEYQKLMAYINREDPKAFITVYNVSHMQYQPKVWE